MLKMNSQNSAKTNSLKSALLNISRPIKCWFHLMIIRSLINSALQAGTERFGTMSYLKDIETRYRIETRNPIPTPWSHINELTQKG